MQHIILKYRKFSIWGQVSIVFIALTVIVALFAPSTSSLPLGQALQPPSKAHLLGTDDLGMDLLSQLLYGARISLLIGFSTSVLAGIGGAILGLLAGYYGGIIDTIIMRLADMIMALPDLPMMILLGTFFGPSLKNIILVLVLFSWVVPARTVRSKVISIKQESYIVMAKSYGASFPYLFKTHFFPEIMPLLAITIIKITSKAIVAEAGLSFLGLGDPTAKSWGLIINHAINFKGIYFTNYWTWWVLAPLLATMLLILSISYISRDLERIYNDKL